MFTDLHSYSSLLALTLVVVNPLSEPYSGEFVPPSQCSSPHMMFLWGKLTFHQLKKKVKSINIDVLHNTLGDHFLPLLFPLCIINGRIMAGIQQLVFPQKQKKIENFQFPQQFVYMSKGFRSSCDFFVQKDPTGIYE